VDKVAAYRIICQVLEKWRNSDFADLETKAGTSFTEEISGASGVLYSVEVDVRWSNPTHRDLIIHARIDDQNTFQFSPLEEEVSVPNPQFNQS
jgi:hypothetical protein